MSRLNYRLIVALALLIGFGIYEVTAELRPSFLRPGLHLFAYVANTGDGTLSVIDLVKLTPISTIPVGARPSGIRAHPTRPEIWGVSSAESYVWVLDAPSNRIVARIPVPS